MQTAKTPGAEAAGRDSDFESTAVVPPLVYFDKMGKTLLVLGCGYVGSALARTALRDGHRVVALSRNEGSLATLRSAGIETVTERLDSNAWHSQVPREVDWVVNCVSSAGGGLTGYRESYVDGNESLRNWFDSIRFRGRAIYTSSVSVYPDARGSWVTEGDALPDRERGHIMLESEKAFLQGSSEGVRTVLRLGGIYGPGRTFLVDRVAKDGLPPADEGGYFLNLVRLEDIVSALLAVLKRSDLPDGEAFNVVDDAPSLKREVVGWIAEKLGSHRAGESSGSSSGGRLREGDPANRRVSNRAIRSKLGWSPRFPSFREGLADFVGLG